MTQREDQEDQASIAMAQAMLAMRYGHSGKFSGGRILDFAEGWAIPAFHFGAVHHLRVIDDEIVAKCGWRSPVLRHRIRGQGLTLLGQGKFKRCVKCQRVVDRKARA